MNAEILFETRGKAGFVILNRPKALNALSFDMVRELSAQLDRWSADNSVSHIVVTGAGEKAFCAGGDIRSIYDAKMAGEADGLSAFFKEEYLLNAKIKNYPKPYLALINGIVMGGGVGVSVHGSHRVGTEKTMFAMPETGIGFFPDVGGTFFLPRMPHRTGFYCALSAGRLKQGDALATGVLTHAVPESALKTIEVALENSNDVDAVLKEHCVFPDVGPIMENADTIERCFSGMSVTDILSELDRTDDPFAQKTAETIRQKSPTSVLIAFEQMKRGGDLCFNECMKLEYRIVSRILMGHDFYEGVRAVIVDKDQTPKWKPAELENVDIGDLASYFEEPTDGDLPL